MNGDIVEITDAYRSKGVLVDTNILILLFVGAVDRDLMARFKRTRVFVPEDLDTLTRYLGLFKTRVTLPNILTEVSNLAEGLQDAYHPRFAATFARGIALLEEYYIASRDLVDAPEFAKFGLTDAAILKHIRGKHLLLTDDLALANYFSSQGGAAVNFNHLRVANWQR